MVCVIAHNERSGVCITVPICVVFWLLEIYLLHLIKGVTLIPYAIWFSYISFWPHSNSNELNVKSIHLVF